MHSYDQSAFSPGLNEIVINIADVVIKAIPREGEFFLELSPPHRRFVVNQVNPDIILYYHYGFIPAIDGSLIFDSGGHWKWYQQNDSIIITLCNPETPTIPYRLAQFNATLSQGNIYIEDLEKLFGKSHQKYRHGLIVVDPFDYPLEEAVLVNYFAQGRGAILHACGVIDQGHGLLFSGVSGAGKSTLARLWMQTDATLLSDDRIIVRPENGRFRFYGTPWHGDAHISSPGSVPLEKIFFIQQAPLNYCQELSPAEVATRLLVRCFPPFYDRQGMDFIVDLLARVAEKTPAYELGFVPDFSVIEYIRGLR